MQQKKSTESLINEGNNLIGEETLMSYEMEFFPSEDKEDLVYLEIQGRNDGQAFGTVTRTKNHNYILTEMDETVSQRILFSDKEEGNHKDEDEATVSQMEEKTVLGLRKNELNDRNGQRTEGKLLKIVKTEVLEENQVINECLKYWLKVSKQEEEIVVNEEDMFLVIKDTGEDIGSQFCDVFTSIQRGVIEYMTAIRKLRDKLIFEIEFAGKEHEKDIAEGDIFKGIQEFWVAAMSRTTSTTIS